MCLSDKSWATLATRLPPLASSLMAPRSVSPPTHSQISEGEGSSLFPKRIIFHLHTHTLPQSSFIFRFGPYTAFSSDQATDGRQVRFEEYDVLAIT